MHRETRPETTWREPVEVLLDTLPAGTRDIVDVGCGQGGLVRRLARRGARVVGVEVAEEPLARARAHAPAADERYVQAGGEALPLPDAGADAVLFINSLHHVPADAMDAALAEAARVLRAGGVLYVQEPLAEGPYHELIRPIDDETAVRAAARAAIARATSNGLAHEREIVFDAPVVHADFAGFRDRVVLADAQRTAAFDRLQDEVRERFHATAERVDGGFRFRQPMRVDVLRRIA